MATDDIHLDNVEDDDDDASVSKFIQKKKRKILESDKIDKKREEIEF